MSRILGIDYGTKNIGIAVSDEIAEFAYPFVVLKNSPIVLDEIVQICKEKGVKKIVIGESKNYQGEENLIMKEVKDFIENISTILNIEIVLHPEFLTSVQAEKMQGKNELTDASAAAIILQSYLDTEKNK